MVDLDIKAFFDTIDHTLMMRAVRKHTDCPWVLLYIERWLKAPAQAADGAMTDRDRGTPQGGVISPLLANLFLHYSFDRWMAENHADTPFERYADDIVIHCRTEARALAIRRAVEERLAACRLEVHPEKTKIVYCRDSNRTREYPRIAFDFLGFTFRPRKAANRWGKFFLSFLPGVSRKAAKEIVTTVRQWRIHSMSDKDVDDLSRMFGQVVRGWVNYYGRFYKSALYPVFSSLNRRLVRWAQKKYRRYHQQRRATHWLRGLARRQPGLFAHWQLGAMP